MKLNKTAQRIIDKLNVLIRDYAVRNGNLYFKLIEKNEKDDYVGSINFGKFTAYFCFDELDIFGYRFLETPISEEKMVGVGSLLTRIKFDFSPLYFSLYDIHNVINSNEFTTLDFHGLCDEDDAEKAFSAVSEFIVKNLYSINNIVSDSLIQKQLTDNYFADLKALNKKPDLSEFETDIYSATLSFESDLYTQPKIENEIDKYLCDGNYSALLKKFYKYKDKGKVTVFEKRFVKFLTDNDFPAISPERKNARKKEKKNAWATWLLTVGIAIVSVFLTIMLVVFIERTSISAFHGDMTYIGVATNHEISFILILVGFMVCVARILHMLPRVKEWTFFNNFTKNVKAINIISIVAVILVLASSVAEVITYKNRSVVSDTTGVYLGEEKLENNGKIEFFHILGYNTYDDNGDEIYESGEGWTDYIMVLDGDYQNYYFCEGLLNEDSSENLSAVDSIKANGFEFQEYKSIEDYCTAHGFEYSEE